MSEEKTILCKTCGSELLGDYCHSCGEKRLKPEDKSARKWLADLFSNIWMLDGKLFNTAKAMMLAPGRFARDYIEGIRKPYVKPLNLFLMANLVYFLTSGFDTFKTELDVQIKGMPYSTLIDGVIENKYGSSEDKTQVYLDFEQRYNTKTGEVSKLIIIVLAPLLGILFYALFRKKGLYLSDGFNLALQFWTYFTVVVLLILPQIFRLLRSLFGPDVLNTGFSSEFWLTPLILILSGLYTYFQFSWLEKRKIALLARVAVVIVAFLPLVFIYRFILFWMTYWML